MQKLAPNRRSNAPWRGQSKYTLDFWYLPLHPGKRSCWLFPKDMEWELHAGQNHDPQATCMLKSLYLQKVNIVGQMNFPYSICGSLYFSRSRGRWTCFWETVIHLARATLSAQQFLSEPHMLQVLPLVTRWHSTDRPQKKHQYLCDWKKVCAELFSKEESPSTEGSGE